jgi:serine/threonine-protein kinase
MATSVASAPEPGTTIAGKYKVGEVLASGGMGVIVEGEHSALGQRVAIKFLLPEAAAQAELVERFLREGRAAARLQSDHVVRVFDIGTDERGAPFMVMELLGGHDLGRESAARGPLPVAESATWSRRSTPSSRRTPRGSSTVISSPVTSSSRRSPTARAG